MHISVIGAGIAGSCVARVARERGHKVTVMADPGRYCSSAAAVCVLRPEWFAGIARSEACYAVDWYRANGCLSAESVVWTSYRTTETRSREGFYAVHPVTPLVMPDVEGRWPDDVPEADVTVLCRGLWSDVDWQRTWGATTVARIIDFGTVSLYGHEDRPRNALYGVHFRSEARFGSSVAKTRDLALERQRKMEVKAVQQGLLPETGLERVVGVRLVSPTVPFPIRRLGNRIWAVEGGGRVGYSFAPSRAQQVLNAIEGATA